MIDTPLKRCSKCGVEFPATTEYFPKRSDTGKLRAQCRICFYEHKRQHYEANKERIKKQHLYYREAHREQLKEKGRRYYEANKEPIKEKAKRYYWSNREQVLEYKHRYHLLNRERRAEYGRKRHQANRERILAQKRQWYSKNQDRCRVNTRRWRKNNPDKIREYAHRRRARKLNATGTHTAEDIRRQYTAQKGRCWWCDCALNGVYHADHLVPLSRGGSNAPENIVLTCPTCNFSKGDKLPYEWNGRLL